MSTWRRVLYEKHQEETNYVPPDFLQNLPTKRERKGRLHGSIDRTKKHGSFAAAWQINVVVIVWETFQECKAKGHGSIFLYTISGLVLLFVAILRWNTQPTSSDETIINSLVLMILTRICTPVVATLTVAYSSRNVNAFIVLTLFLHIFLQDYTFLNGVSSCFRSSSALFAAVFSSVLMASQMKHDQVIYPFLLFAVNSLVTSIFLRQQIKTRLPWVHDALTSASTIGCSYRLFITRSPLLPAYCFSIFCAFFAFPIWLLLFQSHKRMLSGPWDIASVPQEEY